MRKTQGDERELLLSDEALICLGAASLCPECECWGGVGWGQRSKLCTFFCLPTLAPQVKLEIPELKSFHFMHGLISPMILHRAVSIATLA